MNVRGTDGSAVPPEVVFVTGPDGHVATTSLERSAAAWARELGVAVRTVFADDEASLVAALAPSALGDAAGVVLCPAGARDSADVASAADAAGVPVAWVELLAAERPRPPYLRPDTTSIRGRGIAGYRWALAHLLQRLAWPYRPIAYGRDPRDQVADLRLPASGEGPFPVAVLLHGGFWRERWERDTIEPLAVDLARRGFATWNVEYRRVGPHGGGFPATCDDVAAAIDHLADVAGDHALDLDRVVLIGHSAGGQLALWAAGRAGISRPARVEPGLVVALAPVADLVEASRRGIGDTGDATADFMGGTPEAAADRYAAASPIAALPLGVAQLVVQGRLDNTPDLVDLTHRYVDAARAAGDPVAFLELEDADHFDLINPRSEAWKKVLTAMAAWYPQAAAPPLEARGVAV